MNMTFDGLVNIDMTYPINVQIASRFHSLGLGQNMLTAGACSKLSRIISRIYQRRLT